MVKLKEIRNKKIKFFIFTVILVVAMITIAHAIMNDRKKVTLTSTITGEISYIDFNTLWTGSFQLAWNELKTKIGQDIIFEDNNSKILEELNKEIFQMI